MSITLYAKLDMTPGAVPTVVHRSQYDSDFTLVFSLYTRTGDFVIASGTTARMRGTKTSGTGYSVPVTLDVSAKTVTVTGDQQMTAAAGSNIFEIVLYRGDLEICSSNFILQVERAAMDADTITDETVVPELEHLEEYTQQAAEQAAQSASTYAESWAVGGTGTREGEDTNNAKYWSEQAQGAVTGVTSFNGRTGAVVPAANDYTAAQIKRSGGTVESALSSIESVNMNQNSRLTGLESTVAGHGPRITAAENSIASQGTRLTTAEGDIDALEGRATTAESNITTLQSNKVDMTTPLLNFDDTAVDPTTDDGALANALRDLGILSTVALNGVLYIKKTLTEYGKKIGGLIAELSSEAETLTSNNIDLTISRYGKVRVLLIENPTSLAAGDNLIYTLAQKDRPLRRVVVMLPIPISAISSGGTQLSIRATIEANGQVRIYNYRSTNISGNTNANGTVTWITA